MLYVPCLTCEHMTLLLAPGDLREAHEAGDACLEPGWAAPVAGLPWGIAAVVGWKNSAGR